MSGKKRTGLEHNTLTCARDWFDLAASRIMGTGRTERWHKATNAPCSPHICQTLLWHNGDLALFVTPHWNICMEYTSASCLTFPEDITVTHHGHFYVDRVTSCFILTWFITFRCTECCSVRHILMNLVILKQWLLFLNFGGLFSLKIHYKLKPVLTLLRQHKGNRIAEIFI